MSIQMEKNAVLIILLIPNGLLLKKLNHSSIAGQTSKQTIIISAWMERILRLTIQYIFSAHTMEDCIISARQVILREP